MDEETLSLEEQKERKITRLLLKIKNCSPPVRKVGRGEGGGTGGGTGGGRREGRGVEGGGKGGNEGFWKQSQLLFPATEAVR